MPNRLADSRSPYLRQHKDNPVDWFPWCAEAIRKARDEDKPIFLSIGYSSCHWCHVMAHEVFEDQACADVLNRHFVSIKVDREEHPDLDEAYMAAVHLANGRGGWPMSLFLTPEKEPFLAATYIPKEDRGGQPGFLTIVQQIAEKWVENRFDFFQAGSRFRFAIEELRRRQAPGTPGKPGWDTVLNAVETVCSGADLENGGFGDYPKFPPHTAVDLLLAYASSEGVPADHESKGGALAVALLALEAMSLGGIHDQVGGGFHRYSVDEAWFLPHFEKMLYDNALAACNYARASQIVGAGDPETSEGFQRVARRTVDWMLREMRMPNGMFASAIDADSEGEEGLFYLWTVDEIRETLGASAQAFIQAYGLDPNGNYRDEATGRSTGRNVLALEESLGGQFDRQLAQLLDRRAGRVRPQTDTKCLVGWNGLAVSALVSTDHLQEARQAVSPVLQVFDREGRLPRQFYDGQPSGDGYLEDYAYFAKGLLDLGERDAASRVAETMVSLFWDSALGGFFSTHDNHQVPFVRAKPTFDQPMPSGNAVGLAVLLELGEMDKVWAGLNTFHGWIANAPNMCEGLVRVCLDYCLKSGPEMPPIPEPAPVEEVTVTLEPREVTAVQGGVGEAILVIQIPEGWHINSNAPPAKWLVPTEVACVGCKVEIDWPDASEGKYEDLVRLPIRLKADRFPAEFELTVRYQPCTEQDCLLPTEKTIDGVLLSG